MDRIIELPRADRWQSMARAAIREDLYAAHAALTADVLAVGDGTCDAGAALPGVGGAERRRCSAGRGPRWRRSRARRTFDLANLSVAMRTMRTLLRTHS